MTTCDFGVSNRSCWIEVLVQLVTLYVSLVTRLPFALSEARTFILESIQNFLFPWNINMKVPFQVWKQMIYMPQKINFEEPFLVFQKQIPPMSTTGFIHWTKRSVRKVLTLFEHVEEDPMSSSLMSRMKSQWCQWDGVMGCFCCWLVRRETLGQTCVKKWRIEVTFLLLFVLMVYII